MEEKKFCIDCVDSRFVCCPGDALTMNRVTITKKIPTRRDRETIKYLFL